MINNEKKSVEELMQGHKYKKMFLFVGQDTDDDSARSLARLPWKIIFTTKGKRICKKGSDHLEQPKSDSDIFLDIVKEENKDKNVVILTHEEKIINTDNTLYVIKLSKDDSKEEDDDDAFSFMKDDPGYDTYYNNVLRKKS